ncbi:Retinoblastoma-binding protein 5-like protein, partial [Fragariocoptes setiger]
MTLSLALVDTTNLENLPEEFDGTLEPSGLALCCAFNRHGSLLAVGCNDGTVIIYDFLTRTPAKTIFGHLQQICSLSWSRNGRRLAVVSLDNSVTVWDVTSSKCLLRWEFPSPLVKVQFNPRNDKVILICPYKHPPIILHTSTYEDTPTQRNHYIVPTDPDDADTTIVASFDRRGQYIYTGNSKGRVAVIRCPTEKEFMDIEYSCSTKEEAIEIMRARMKVVASFRLQASGSVPIAIKEIEFATRSKHFFLINASDRTIRKYKCDDVLACGLNGDCEEVCRFQELVSKTLWRRCCFSGNPQAAYVCGASARQHALYIWDAETGIIKKMLDGRKGELLLDVQWHPLRPVLVSISNGIVSVWRKAQIENWSAYAPNFKELEENMEYEERESEFDLDDEDKPPVSKDQQEEEDVDVDVVTSKLEIEFLSSDEEEEDPEALIVLPVVLDDQECEQAERA